MRAVTEATVASLTEAGLITIDRVRSTCSRGGCRKRSRVVFHGHGWCHNHLREYVAHEIEFSERLLAVVKGGATE